MPVRVRDFKVFSNPAILNSIIWHNRSFYFLVDETGEEIFMGLKPDVENGEGPGLWGYVGRRYGDTDVPRPALLSTDRYERI